MSDTSSDEENVIFTLVLLSETDKKKNIQQKDSGLIECKWRG